LVVAVDARELPDDSQALASRLDAEAATRLREYGQRLTPAALLPLPVAGLAGWDPERDYLGERRFDDASIFRRRPGD
jgi:hypothetical protein